MSDVVLKVRWQCSFFFCIAMLEIHQQLNTSQPGGKKLRGRQYELPVMK